MRAHHHDTGDPDFQDVVLLLIIDYPQASRRWYKALSLSLYVEACRRWYKTIPTIPTTPWHPNYPDYPLTIPPSPIPRRKICLIRDHVLSQKRKAFLKTRRAFWDWEREMTRCVFSKNQWSIGSLILCLPGRSCILMILAMLHVDCMMICTHQTSHQQRDE